MSVGSRLRGRECKRTDTPDHTTVGSKCIVLGKEGTPESPISKILIRKS